MTDREEFEAWCIRRWGGDDRGAFERNPDSSPKYPGEYKNGNVEFAYKAFLEGKRIANAG